MSDANCKKIYPSLYRRTAERVIFHNLPFLVNERIHDYRNLDDLQIDDTKVKKILGYGQSLAKDEILDRFQQCGDAVLNNDFRADKEVMLIAVIQSAYFLRFASVDLRGDKDVVMTAVAQNGYVLQYASEELRDDKDVVITAVAQDSQAFQFASDRLKDDENCVAVACQGDTFMFSCASVRIRQNVKLTNHYFAIARSGLPIRITDEVILDFLGVVR